MADPAYTTWTPPLRKDGTPFPDIAALAQMPEYLREMYLKIMRDDAPPSDLMEAAVLVSFRQDMVGLSEKTSRLRVYFIQTESGPIKIGYAGAPRKRLHSMQSGSFEKLTLLCVTPGGAHQEAKFHTQFRKYWLRGEWFAPHPDILAEIERLSSPSPLLCGE